MGGREGGRGGGDQLMAAPGPEVEFPVSAHGFIYHRQTRGRPSSLDTSIE